MAKKKKGSAKGGGGTGRGGFAALGRKGQDKILRRRAVKRELKQTGLGRTNLR